MDGPGQEEQAVDNFNQRMIDHRKGEGRERVAQRAAAFLPEPMTIDSNIVARLEGKGNSPFTEETANAFHVRAIALAYGVPLADLSELAQQRIDATLQLLAAQGGPSSPGGTSGRRSDRGEHLSGWRGTKAA